MRTILFFIIALVFVFSISASQEKIGGKIHGLIVGDYFYKVGGDSQQYGNSFSQYSQPMPKDFQSFQIRRLHLFYDYNISESFSTRFQLEGNNKSLEPGGRQGLYMKTAYGEWKNIFSASNLLVGLVPTPTWSSVEGIWGYRSIEKTILDFRDLGIASDMGVHLRGTILSELQLNYSVMIGNGTAQKPENNKYKKYYIMISGTPITNISVEAYMDYEPAADDKDRTTWKAFLYYQEKSLMIGAEIVEQVEKNQGALPADKAAFGLSLFSWFGFSEQCKAYGRIDYYDPDRLSPGVGFYECFISLGFDYMPIKNFHFMPNIWINTFTDKSSAGRIKYADIVPRITFFFVFN